MNSLIAEIIEANLDSAKAKGLQIDFVSVGEMPSIEQDRDLIGQIIANYLGTAIMFSDPGRKISLSLVGKTEENAVEIVISDMAASSDLKAASHKDLQAETKTENKEKFNAPEDNICRMIMEAHGGKTKANIVIGKEGKMFSFTILQKQVDCLEKIL